MTPASYSAALVSVYGDALRRLDGAAQEARRPGPARCRGARSFVLGRVPGDGVLILRVELGLAATAQAWSLATLRQNYSSETRAVGLLANLALDRPALGVRLLRRLEAAAAWVRRCPAAAAREWEARTATPAAQRLLARASEIALAGRADPVHAAPRAPAAPGTADLDLLPF